MYYILHIYLRIFPVPKYISKCMKCFQSPIAWQHLTSTKSYIPMNIKGANYVDLYYKSVY